MNWKWFNIHAKIYDFVIFMHILTPINKDPAPSSDSCSHRQLICQWWLFIEWRRRSTKKVHQVIRSLLCRSFRSVFFLDCGSWCKWTRNQLCEVIPSFSEFLHKLAVYKRDCLSSCKRAANRGRIWKSHLPLLWFTILYTPTFPGLGTTVLSAAATS